MEGGLLPWRTQKIEGIYPDIDSFTKCLPNPPANYSWTRNSDHSWTLSKVTNDTDTPIMQEVSATPIIVEHTVLSSDTLSGLCLKYRTSPTELRRINCFSGNNIQFKSTLKIPITPGIPFNFQQDTHEILLQKFKNATNESQTEALLYLEDNNWDLNKALHTWHEDDIWSKRNENRNIENNIIYSNTLPPEGAVVEAADVRLVNTVKPSHIINFR